MREAWRAGPMLLALLIPQLAGYFAGQWIHATVVQPELAKLGWGWFYGLGLGAGMAWALWLVQRAENRSEGSRS